MQIPVVDGKHWWYHVAALENWPVAFGEPELVEEVRSQIMMLYKNTAPNGGAAPAPAANANPGCQILISAVKALHKQNAFSRSPGDELWSLSDGKSIEHKAWLCQDDMEDAVCYAV